MEDTLFLGFIGRSEVKGRMKDNSENVMCVAENGRYKGWGDKLLSLEVE